MRLFALFATATLIANLAPLAAPAFAPAAAAECTGDNCPPPSGQGRGHDCERKRQEQTTS